MELSVSVLQDMAAEMDAEERRGRKAVRAGPDALAAMGLALTELDP